MALNTLLSFMILTAVTLLSATESYAQTSDSSPTGKAKTTVGELSKKPKQKQIAIEPKKEISDEKRPSKSADTSSDKPIQTTGKWDLTVKNIEEGKTSLETSEEKYRPLPKPSPTPPTTKPQDFPKPINDNANHSFVLFELLEYNAAANGNNSINWDMIGWYGGDYNRLWFRSEGEIEQASTAAGDVEFQALYGRMIAPFFDFQVGVRFDEKWEGGERASRFHAVVGVIGLSPYEYEVEPLLFISDRGDVSFRFTGTKDILLTQRTILEARFETNLAAQKVEKFGVGSGLNDMEFGIRIRREIKREFAPYIGVSYKRLFGETADFTRLGGGRADQLSLVGGVRIWF